MSNLNNRITVFEHKLQRCFELKFGQKITGKSSEEFILFNILNISSFCSELMASNIQTELKINKWLDILFDIKFEIALILLVDQPLYNILLPPNRTHATTINNEYFRLAELSIHQSMIIKNIITWERIINFIYMFETGEQIERKITKNKTKSKIFDEFIEKNNKWKFLKRYSQVIGGYKDYFRTPEIHKLSTLRAHFINNKQEKLDLINIPFGMMISVIRMVLDSCLNKSVGEYGSSKMDELKN